MNCTAKHLPPSLSTWHRRLACCIGMGLLGMGLASCTSSLPRPVVARSSTVEQSRPPSAASPSASIATTPRPAASKRGGGYYLDDGPGDDTPSPEALAAIPDAQPKPEALNRYANKPYTVFNREYVPLTTLGTYKAQGIGSWYGRKFHGQKTSNGEVYDMFGMTAAHPTLPIPSYARVTNPANGKAVVVRVNDRGPFHAGRIIDLSYVAAWKLGYVGNGSTLLDVESLQPGASAPLLTSAEPQPPRGDPLAELIQRVNSNTPPLTQTTTVLPELKEARGLFLQLGAFSSRENAESFKAHLSRELPDAPQTEDAIDFSNKLLVQSRAGLYRVQLGPWPDQASAQRAAERLREMFDIKPMVVRQ